MTNSKILKINLDVMKAIEADHIQVYKKKKLTDKYSKPTL